MTTSTGTSADYLFGLDLGQANDFTAMAVVQRRPGVVNPTTGRQEPVYHLRHLERPALGTLYTTIVERVTGLLATPPLSSLTPLVVDQTGVGAGIVDMFRAAGRRPVAITITGGDTVNREDPSHVRVPKRDLVGALVALFQSKRLIVAEGLPLASTLVNELLNFKLKVNLQTGHDSYEAWRESVHDDLLLAVALACWYAENQPPTPGPPAVRAHPRTLPAGVVYDMWQGAHRADDPYLRKDRPFRETMYGEQPQSDGSVWDARPRPPTTGD